MVLGTSETLAPAHRLFGSTDSSLQTRTYCYEVFGLPYVID